MLYSSNVYLMGGIVGEAPRIHVKEGIKFLSMRRNGTEPKATSYFENGFSTAINSEQPNRALSGVCLKIRQLELPLHSAVMIKIQIFFPFSLGEEETKRFLTPPLYRGEDKENLLLYLHHLFV